MSVINDLIATRAHISDPAKWTQGTFGRDRHGSPTYPFTRTSEAVSWCMIGAMHTVCELDVSGISRVASMIDAVNGRLGLPRYSDDRWSIVRYNDSHSHSEIMDLLDKTIEAERAKARQKVIDDLLFVPWPAEVATERDGQKGRSRQAQEREATQ